nr:zinc finger, CCHC-type [Tanacetum cinerariifolium]
MAAVMKHMASSFAKLEKFEGVHFKRLKNKMHFMVSSMNVVYVLTTPMPEDEDENPTVEQVRKRAKWDNDDYVCRGLILNEAKYMAEVASSKKFLASNFTNYKMSDSRPVLEQYSVLLGILGRFTQHKMNMDESIHVSYIINKLPPSWKDFKHTLKYLKEELTLIELGSHMCIEESLRVQDNDKLKGNNVVGPSVVNMVEHNNSSMYNDNKGKCKHLDTRANHNKKPKVTCWKYGKPTHLKKDCKAGNVGNRANGSSTKGSEDGSSNPLKGQSMFNKSHKIYYVTYVSEAFFVQDDDVAWAPVRLPDLQLKTLGKRGIECIFVGYAKHSKAFGFCVIEPNDSVAINSIIESRDAIFHKHKFSSIPRLSQRMLKVDGTVEKFKARLVIQGFKQKSRIDCFDTYAPVVRICTTRLLIAMASIHNLIIHQMDVKTTFLNRELEEEVDLTKEFLSSRFSMKDMGDADVILGIRIKHESNGIAISQSHYIEKVMKKFNYSNCTLVSKPLDTYEKLMPNRGLAVYQLEYSIVIGCLMYAMTCTIPYIAFVVGKLSRYASNLGTQHWQAIQRVLNNTEDNSSTSGWVFLLGGGVISWASKKQTCITGSTMESEFMALAAAGKEAERLKNFLLEIPLWVKPITPIYIRCNSAATLAKGYRQMYNGKSRHLGVRHSMIRELITNRVRAEAHVLQIILRICLKPAGKEDEGANFSMVNFFEKLGIFSACTGIRLVDDKRLPFLVTINPTRSPAYMQLKWTTGHPVPSVAASKASLELHRIQGKRGIRFCGAYQGRVDNVYGDRNLICTLQPPQEYEEKVEATA